MSKLIVSSSLTPNIVAHVVACSGIGGRRDYGYEFAHTLTEEERQFIRRFQKDFSRSPPLSGGPFFSILFQIPSYFYANDLESTIRSNDRLLDFLQGASFEEGISPEETRALEFWSPRELREWSMESLKPMFGETERTIKRFGDVLVSCYVRFYSEYWTRLLPGLMAKAKQIQDSMKDLVE